MSRLRRAADRINGIAATQIVKQSERRECDVNTCAVEMNAHRVSRFPLRPTTFSRDIFQNPHRLSLVSSGSFFVTGDCQ
jgi:hypothetical protein